MIKKLPYKITLFLTLILSQSLHGAAAAAAIPETRVATEFDNNDDLSMPALPPSPTIPIATETELNAAFARQQRSVREGLAPLALGGHGPLNIVFAYLKWDKSKPDLVNENSSSSKDINGYVMKDEGQGFYRSIGGRIEFHSARSNNPSGVIYSSPSFFPTIRTFCRLHDGRLAALLTDHTQGHIMTLCPRTHVAAHSHNVPMQFNMGYIRQSGNYLLMSMYDNCAAFHINHHQPPYMLTCAPGDRLRSIKLDDRNLLLKFQNQDNRCFVRRYDAATLVPICDRLEIERNTTDLPEPPHIALLGGKELLVQNENSSRVIDIETGAIIHPKIATMRNDYINHILRLKNMNRSAKCKGVLIADNCGRIGHLKIGNDRMSFTMLTNRKLTPLTAYNKLQQLSHDQVAQLMEDNLTIWSINSKTRLANFSKEFLYNRSILGAVNRFIKFHRGCLIVADSAGNVARLMPESDIEMAYNGKRSLTIKPSGAPAMKSTLPIIRDALPIPAKKV